MHINSLILKNFRSYESLSVSFSDGINILQGKNAAGKTNVLEAVGFLSMGKSFRTQKESECIREGTQSAYIKGGIVKREGQLSVEALLSVLEKKSLKINSQPVKKMGELFGNFIAVVFSPEDLKVLKESPSLRRRFVDLEISKLKPAYFYSLLEYGKALTQKNALLKSHIAEHQLKKLVTIYNEQLADHGAHIIKSRQAFLQRLDELSRAVHQTLATHETLSLRYKCSAAGDDPRTALFEKMEGSLSSEIEQGFCLYGPHREDFAVALNGSEIKAYSSQGQIRTAMLALKLATFEIARGDFGENPVLLLDDVFSELDTARQSALLDHIRSAQCFITTAVPLKCAGAQIHTVADGKIISASS